MATTAADSKALKQRVLSLEVARHDWSALGSDRAAAKLAKLEGFIDRAIERGLTMAHVDENLVAGRPPHWIETSE